MGSVVGWTCLLFMINRRCCCERRCKRCSVSLMSVLHVASVLMNAQAVQFLKVTIFSSSIKILVQSVVLVKMHVPMMQLLKSNNLTPSSEGVCY